MSAVSYRIALNRRRLNCSNSLTASLPLISKRVANPEFEAWSKAWRISWSIGLICILHGCIFAFCGGWHPDLSREFYLTESNNLRGAVSLRHIVAAPPALSSTNSNSLYPSAAGSLSLAGGAVASASTPANHIGSGGSGHRLSSPYWNSPFDHGSGRREKYNPFIVTVTPRIVTQVSSRVLTSSSSRVRYQYRGVASSTSSSSSSCSSGCSSESDDAADHQL